jgi:hypothetical protein
LKKSLRRSSFADAEYLRQSFSEGLPFFLCHAAELLGRPDVRNMLRTEKVKKNGGRKKVTQLSFV